LKGEVYDNITEILDAMIDGKIPESKDLTD
jgi:hypothetical protein